MRDAYYRGVNGRDNHSGRERASGTAGATTGDLDLIDESCTATVVDHNPLGEVRGREALNADIESLRTAFSDVSATVEAAVADGDAVAMRLTLRGTHAGEFVGIEATGADIEVGNMVFTRIADGQIAERWVQADMFGVMQQLGIVDLPDT